MRKISILLLVVLFLTSFVNAQVVSDTPFSGGRSGTASYVNYGSSFTSYYGSNANTYWPILSNRDACTASQDIVIQVTPVGCQPAVVRSDLLAEQNVPVFCQLDLLQVNPAINIKQIRNIRFGGNYPSYVAGVGFHPANAALRTNNQLLGTPLESNIGYVVVVLKRTPDEKEMPDFFNFTLSASVDYYSGNAIGVGATELLLKETDDKEWEVAKNRQTLFGGKMSVRVKDIDSDDSIYVELYSGDEKYSEITLQKRGTQQTPIYLPGSYCQTQLQFSYTDFVAPNIIARLKVDDDVLDLYENSRFLNGKCVLRKIDNSNSLGIVDISCGNQNAKLSNSLNILTVGTEVYKVNNKTFELIKDSKYVVKSVINKNNEISYELSLIGSDKVDSTVKYHEVRSVENAEFFDKSYSSEIESYINNATEQYEILADSYGNEKKELGKLYGDIALSNAIRLNVEYEKKKDAVRLIEKYLQNYPNGENVLEFTQTLNELYVRDSSSSIVSIQSDDGYHTIKLLDVSGASKKSSAKISWGNQEKVLQQGETYNFGTGNLTLVNVNNFETIEVSAVCAPRQGTSGYNGKITLNDNTKTACNGGTIRVSNVEFESYVKLRISPVTRQGTATNFTVGIGIEKRAIELTPSKAKKKIDNLNKSIEKWESISNSLGKVVTGLKAACFATAGVLTVKNFFTGLSGESMARRNVMAGENGWTKICQSEINNKKYSTLTECYNAHAEDIRKDVNAGTKAIEQSNALTKRIEESSKIPNSEGVFTGSSFDENIAKKKLAEQIRTECGNKPLGNRSNTGGMSYATVGSLFSTGYDVKSYSYTQLRDIYYNCKIIDNGGSSTGGLRASTELDNIGYNVGQNLNREAEIKKVQTGVSGTKLSGIPIDTYGNEKALIGKYRGGNLGINDFGISDVSMAGKPAQVIHYNGKPYLFVLNQIDGNTLVPEKVYGLTQQNNNYVIDSSIDTKDVSGTFSKFEPRDSKSYNNQFGSGQATVRYFETEPYKGMPAVVPFDLNRGFYAATTQALPIFGGTKSYESSGNPSSFFVCNIMNDKQIGFYAPNYGDDECVQFNLYTGQSFSSFPGLSEEDTKRIVNQAISALKEAAGQYGKSNVRIGTNTLNVGNAASLLPGSQCQDYMSPEDCKILFNVCDPVICPASRCNFGGSYYVSDVIQSGIVGSALLCLPNVKEGIVMPVCLTGLKAGIDGYLSILKSHRQCLQESIETGKYVGICDQISSVYMCEFFWRQAAPLAKAILPKVVEYAYTGGQGNVRGGGEYMTVQSSWQNAQDSVEYFTQSYAVNSLEAFKIRSLDEAGTEICRAFVSTKFPKSFETLVEPDSPPQFHAWFSSIDYTDATVPATSQYKVFYHIFAGNDRGVSYSVYLKDPPASVQYSTNPVVVVQTGFIARGQYATESKDFTAPKGYQQLCVRINDKEECGFKQVSSSFAVNYVRDSVVSDELTRKDVTTETECVSGSVSPAALLNPNLQSAAEEALNPQIYNRGIVRVCATDNPGKGTDETRFVKVGVCGSDRMGCWLDKNSLDKAITDINKGVKAETLSQIETIQKDYLKGNENYKDSSQIKAELEQIQKEVEGAQATGLNGILIKLDSLMLKTFWNYDKAEIVFWKAKLYENVFKKSVDTLKAKGSATNIHEGTTVPLPPTTETPSNSESRILSFELDGQRNYIYINGQPTGIYLQSNIIFSDDRIGHVEGSKLVFENDNERDRIDGVFGFGTFDFLSSGITLEQIQAGQNTQSTQTKLTLKIGNPTFIIGNRFLYVDGKETKIYFAENKGLYYDSNWIPGVDRDEKIGTYDDKGFYISEVEGRLKFTEFMDIEFVLYLLENSLNIKLADLERSYTIDLNVENNNQQNIIPEGARILSFNDGYDESKKSYIYLNNKKTIIYLQNKVIYSDFNTGLEMGNITEGKISLNPSSEGLINTVFGNGAYDLINQRVFVENIQSNCNLIDLAAVSGSVTVPSSCLQNPPK